MIKFLHDILQNTISNKYFEKKEKNSLHASSKNASVVAESCVLHVFIAIFISNC